MAKKIMKEIIETFGLFVYFVAWIVVLLMLKNKGPEFSPLLGLALFVWNSVVLIRHMK